MNYFISKKQFLILEESEPALTPMEISLFKELNRKKPQLKTKKQLEEFLKRFLVIFELDERWAFYYLEKWLMNYREDGKYNLITKDNYVDPKFAKGKRTQNILSDRFTMVKMPFKGSNLEGYWTKDGRGNEIYVVDSYGWYPIYIFRDDKWYTVTQRYSSSTSRQIRHSRPIGWAGDNHPLYALTAEEMQLLKRGLSHDEIMNYKLKKLKKEKQDVISKRLQSQNVWYNDGKYKVKFKIKDVEVNESGATVYVDVYDVASNRTGSISFDSSDFDKEFYEKRLTQALKTKMQDFLGKEFYWSDVDDKEHLLNFVFNFVKK